MNSCLIFTMVIIFFACYSSSKVIVKQPKGKIALPKHENSSLGANLKFYKFCSILLAEFMAEQEMIALFEQRVKESRLRQKEEKAKEIFRNKLASRIRSSFIRDFLHDIEMISNYKLKKKT